MAQFHAWKCCFLAMASWLWACSFNCTHAPSKGRFHLIQSNAFNSSLRATEVDVERKRREHATCISCKKSQGPIKEEEYSRVHLSHMHDMTYADYFPDNGEKAETKRNILQFREKNAPWYFLLRNFSDCFQTLSADWGISVCLAFLAVNMRVVVYCRHRGGRVNCFWLPSTPLNVASFLPIMQIEWGKDILPSLD